MHDFQRTLTGSISSESDRCARSGEDSNRKLSLTGGSQANDFQREVTGGCTLCVCAECKIVNVTEILQEIDFDRKVTGE